MEKAWFMALMGKALWPHWNIPSWFISPTEKAWLYETLFFQVVMLTVKEKKDALKGYNVDQNALCITGITLSEQG